MTEDIPPCREDYVETGRDWTSPWNTRAEFRYMVSLCQACPLKEDCYMAGKNGQLDMGGIKRGHQTGVWGGYVWRNGRPLDPSESNALYPLVHWEDRRNFWKAEAQVGSTGREGTRKIHLGYFRNEDDAVEVARRWLRKHNRYPELEP